MNKPSLCCAHGVIYALEDLLYQLSSEVLGLTLSAVLCFEKAASSGTVQELQAILATVHLCIACIPFVITKHTNIY